MAITPIITNAEADVFLANYSAWIALSNAVKDVHILNASLFISIMWTCVDIDMTDVENIPEEIKQACALYALADSVGNLFGSPDVSDDRKTSKELIKAGPITIEETFSGAGVNALGMKHSFGLPNSLMSLYCTASNFLGSAPLTRV